MQVGEKLVTVQVTPDPLGQMVVDAKLASTLRTAKPVPRRMLNINFNALPRKSHLDSPHRPGRRQSKQMPGQLHPIHRMSSLQSMRESVLPTHRNA